jgi:hypothetical protein
MFLFQNTEFRRLDSVSVFKWNLLSWAQSIKISPVSGHQHNRGYINYHSRNHLRELRKTLKNSTRVSPSTYDHTMFHGYSSQNQSTMRIGVITRETNSLYGANSKTPFPHLIYTGRSCTFLTNTAIMGVLHY